MESILRPFSEDKRWSRKMFKKPSAAEEMEMLILAFLRRFYLSLVGIDLNSIPLPSMGVLRLNFAYSDMEVCQ